MNQVYEDILRGVKIPQMSLFRQSFSTEHITDIESRIRGTVAQVPGIDRISGKTVALAVGSRGISHIAKIAKTMVSVLREHGAKVFIVPAMGSHGGAVAENQKKILEHLGVTEEYTEAEIRASMETVIIGETEDGVPVNMDKNAASADYTVTIARIKPHCSFRGKYESGMIKMCVIGLGKQKGADYCHYQGMANMGRNLEKIGRVFRDNSNVLFSLGIIENSYDEPCFMEAIPMNEIMEREPELLEKAKALLPSIPFDNIDLLIVDEFGKNITGTGMDCNIIQRFTSEHMIPKSFIKRLAVLDLTDESDGNAAGFGLADISTERAFSKMDREKTYPNFLTARTVKGGMVPLIMADDYDAIRTGIKTCPDVDYDHLRVVRIKNTLRLDLMEVSSSMIDEAVNKGLTLVEGPYPLCFDKNRNLITRKW